MPDIDISALTHEDRAILFWALAGYETRRWTREQEVMVLLGSLSCPDGHVGRMDMYWPDGQVMCIRKAEGAPLLEPGLESSEGFDFKNEYPACGCRHPDCELRTDNGAFYVPPDVYKVFNLD